MNRNPLAAVDVAAVAARFWAKVDRSGADCWPWTAGRNPNGYGKFCIRKPLSTTAHRVSFLLSGGVIPEGHVVCHRCDNPTCVNPAHLFAGTQRDNVHDMIGKGRAATRGGPLGDQAGEANNAAKLTSVDVLLIRARHERGDRTVEIAADFGVKYHTIWAIISGRTWGHLL